MAKALTKSCPTPLFSPVIKYVYFATFFEAICIRVILRYNNFDEKIRRANNAI